MKKIKDFSIKQKLALSALVLGTFAAFAGNPYDNAKAVVDTKELSIIIEKQSDHITVDELAEWIIKGKSDYRLVDLNEAAKFEEYHIPSAENIALTDLNKADIMRNEKIILYSDGGIHSAQAWMLMKAKGFKAVYTLLGGLEEWKETILFPSVTSFAGPEDSLAFEKRKEISKYFGGVPQTGGNTTEVKSTTPLPKMQLPSGGGVTPAGTKKKKKEGC